MDCKNIQKFVNASNEVTRNSLYYTYRAQKAGFPLILRTKIVFSGSVLTVLMPWRVARQRFFRRCPWQHSLLLLYSWIRRTTQSNGQVWLASQLLWAFTEIISLLNMNNEKKEYKKLEKNSARRKPNAEMSCIVKWNSFTGDWMGKR